MKTPLLLTSFLLFVAACSAPQSDRVYSFDLSSDCKKSAAVPIQSNSVFEGESLFFEVTPQNNELILSTDNDSIPWQEAKYFVCEIYHSNPYSLLVNVCFYRKENIGSGTGNIKQGEEIANQSGNRTPWVSCMIGVLPQLKTQVIFPLSYLDAQQIFMPRFPRQLKGTLSGKRLDIDDIAQFSLKFTPQMAPDFLPKLQIKSAYLCKELPIPYSTIESKVVDSLGQWTARTWENKIPNQTALQTAVKQTEELAKGNEYPANWSKYGGWKDGPRFAANGYFGVKNDGKRWWFVDPEGYPFLSAGVTCIRPNATGLLEGQEELFSWIPPKDEVYKEAYGTNSIDFAKINMIRTYGDKWYEQWKQTTAGLMRRWQINTVANWSDIDFAREYKIPYVLNMEGFPRTEVLLFRDFPDVFSPEYQSNAITFASQLEKFKNDPYLVGYFLSNEPHWGFGYNNIAFEMFATKTPSSTKTAMLTWLKTKYATVDQLNTAWNLSLANIDDLGTMTFKDPSSPQAWKDCEDFSKIAVRKYVQVVCDEVTKIDPNHLNMGMRYAWVSSDLLYEAGEYFDVFSINGYNYPAPPATDEIARRSGKPVIIGEWHFGSAIEGGLPATGIQSAASQQDRADAYQYYLEQGFARPELIGMHWFQWNDQPIYGRFDGENYNIGFLDVCQQPYQILVESAKQAHNNMYEVATGKRKPFDKIIRRVPQIYY